MASYLEYESDNVSLSEWKQYDCGGYPVDYRDILVDGKVLPKNALVFVRDSSESDWYPARFEEYRDELWATTVDDNTNGAWRHVLIPKTITILPETAQPPL